MLISNVLVNATNKGLWSPGCFRRIAALLILLPWTLGAPRLVGAVLTVGASHDNTIYGGTDLSAGASAYLFAGKSGANGGSRTLRSLLEFDLSTGIPAGSTINAVTLSLAVNTPHVNTGTIELHAALNDWGEGTSAPGLGGAGGAAATPNDATWNFAFFNTTPWTNPGGDFAGASAFQAVAGNGAVSLSSAGMVSDVQQWVNNPVANYGWFLLMADESSAAIRFASRESGSGPSLEIDYTPVPEPGIISLGVLAMLLACGRFKRGGPRVTIPRWIRPAA